MNTNLIGNKSNPGDVKCRRCGKYFDPYEKIEFIGTGERALSTCPHCGYRLKVHKVAASKEYEYGKDGWRRIKPKVKMSKKARRKMRKGSRKLSFKMVEE